MTDSTVINELELAQEARVKSALTRSLPWLVFCLLVVAAGTSKLLPSEWSVLGWSPDQLLLVLSIFPALMILKFWGEAFKEKKILQQSREIRNETLAAENSSSVQQIEAVLTNAKEKARTNRLVEAHLEERLPALEERLRAIRKDEAKAALNANVHQVTLKISPFLTTTKENLPIFQARNEIKASLKFLRQRRSELQQQWDAAYSQFSWWNKLKYSSGPDFSGLDRTLIKLKLMEQKLDRQHGEDFAAIEKHFELLKKQATDRVLEARNKAEEFIEQCDGDATVGSSVLRKSTWLSMLSVPVSVWTDADRASNVFDAVRSVNGNFAGMSDSDIWWETLFMPAESLAGLAALTKGAYFEQLVAADTGGQLHEHFNQPDTDIVVDGTAFQIKATDSESYVDSVAEGIPVISTSEVALATGSIDSGYSNEELSNTVDLALGGTVVDVGDTAVDAILAGLGGLGFFATLEGLNHAVKKHENGGDGVEAIFEGAGVAIEGTARALVGAAEMGYKVLSSKPSRFVGRMMLKGLVKLDEKMTGQPDRK